MNTEKLLYIVVDYACGGVVLHDDIVVRTPPIFRWMMGKRSDAVQQWIKKRGGEVTELEV